jgi:hypothetical protein
MAPNDKGYIPSIEEGTYIESVVAEKGQGEVLC